MNEMNISQASTVLNKIVQQATGQATIANIQTPEDFVSVAQTALKTGYDPVINAISQIWSRTIFANRPYNAKFRSLERSLPRYGNAVRKLSPIARQMSDDQRFIWPVAYDAVNHAENALGNGESVDMYKTSKQEVLQTNFYGTAVYQQRFTIYKDQFDVAFSSADEFGRFNSMNMLERQNDKESFVENVGRGLQANFIAAILDEKQNTRIIHLLTEYNTESGLQLTAQTVKQPENFAPFMRWSYAKIATIARLFSDRSQMFQTIINGKPVLRHTDAENLRLCMLSSAAEQMNAMVNSVTYHDDYLRYANLEYVNFWQDIEKPDSVKIQPVYTDNTGAVKKADSEVEQAGIFAVMHDRDALGYAVTNSWSAVTPLNIDGGYWNEAYHANIKTISDVTEKAVVFLLD